MANWNFLQLGRLIAHKKEASMTKRGRKLWSDSEIAKLKSMAGIYPTAQIAQELGRGLSATMVKAHQLHISLRRKPTTRTSNMEPGPAGMDLS
jgi:hypothetical protein